MQIPCSYCGYDIEVPDDFVPDNVEEVVEERFDEKSGAFLLIERRPLIQCKFCRRDVLRDSRTLKPKGKPRPDKKLK